MGIVDVLRVLAALPATLACGAAVFVGAELIGRAIEALRTFSLAHGHVIAPVVFAAALVSAAPPVQRRLTRLLGRGDDTSAALAAERLVAAKESAARLAQAQQDLLSPSAAQQRQLSAAEAAHRKQD